MARNRVWTAAVGLVVAVVVGGPVAAGAAPAGGGAVQIPAHIRVRDCRLAAALAGGLTRSSSLRNLVDRIWQLKGIVYISTSVSVSPGSTHALVGALSHHIAVADIYRVMQITVTHDDDDRAVATLAHEFQHTVEVLEHPEVRTEADVDRLFERIGYRVASGLMETQAGLPRP
jgi:hypothetical protein